MTFVRVARGQTVTEPWLRPGADAVSPFLDAHVSSLQARASDGTAANAVFGDLQQAQLFTDILSGTEEAFLSAAHVLSTRLVHEMNKKGKALPGLLVCASLTGDTDAKVPVAVVLKLQVVSEQGAILKRLDTGEETLAAVTNVLDKPGELQKGIIFPDLRPTSSATVGDKATINEAQYFLAAMGVTLEARPRQAAGLVLKAVAQNAPPATVSKVIPALNQVPPGSVADVLDALQDSVPELSDDTVSQVTEALTTGLRPVTQVDTTVPLRGRIRAGRLTIDGPAEAIDGVTWSEQAQGGWRVMFISDREPVKSWKER